MKMKFFVSRFMGLALVCALLSANLAGRNPEPQMVVSHYAQGSSRGVLEWDCPVFAAYSDGTVIWRRNWAQALDAFATVKRPVPDALVTRLGALVAAHNGKTFVLTGSIDPERTTIWYLGKRVEILGPWEKPRVIEGGDHAQIAAINETELKLWKALPQEIRQALGSLAAFEDRDSSPWSPAELVVTLMPAGKALGSPVDWPSQWVYSFENVPGCPGLMQTKMPGAMLPELLSVVSDGGQPKAVLFGRERKYVQIGIIFPGEAAWTKR